MEFVSLSIAGLYISSSVNMNQKEVQE
jgi:hypothetical protein